ncbi:hypothetical protein YTPLAS18_04710 [Nitrospira sp.]|nr:hypothetical protein YTPLAS18_04710 [Nitrospira sp.]
MHARRSTRPIKMITFTGIAGATQLAVNSELIPLAERWRGVSERLARVNRGILVLATFLWDGLTKAAHVLRRRLNEALRWIRPRVAAGTTGAFRVAQAGTRGMIRTVRRLRGRIRRVRRQRTALTTRRAENELIETLHQLRWEVQVLQSQIRTQQDMLIQLASERSDRNTDIAWVARMIAPEPQLRDDSTRGGTDRPKRGYFRPPLTQLGSLQRLGDE